MKKYLICFGILLAVISAQAQSFFGNGYNITNLNANNGAGPTTFLTNFEVANATLSGNLILGDGLSVVSGGATFDEGVTIANGGENVTGGGTTNNTALGFNGNGFGLTNLNLSGLRCGFGMLNSGPIGTVPGFLNLMSGQSTRSTTETNASVFLPGPFLLTNFTVNITTPVLAGTNFVFTIRTNGVSTGITVTFTAANTPVQSDTTHFVSSAVGMWVDLQFAPTITSSFGGNFNWSTQF